MAAHLDLTDFLQPVAVVRHHLSMERMQWERPDRMRALLDRRLLDVLRHAVRYVPRYRSVPLDGADAGENLRQFPLLDRRTARTERSSLVADDLRGRSPRSVSTSGTTGTPFEVLLDRASFAMEFAHYWRHWSWAGYRLGDRFVEFSTAHFLQRPSEEFILQRLAGRLVLNAAFLNAERVRAHAERFRRHRPRFVKSAPSTLASFCDLCGDLGIRLDGVRAVFLQGETLRPDQRLTVERFFGCKAYDSYGQMERVAAIAECPSGRLHVIEDYGRIEWMPEPSPGSGPHAERPEGVYPARIVGTSLHSLAMPLIRYETGDRVWLDETPSPCPCGRSFGTVRSIEGRSEDVVTTPDGRVLGAAYLSLSGIPGLRCFQIVQDRADRAEARLWISPGTVEPLRSAVFAAVRERLSGITGPSLDWSLTAVDGPDGWLEPGRKFRTVINTSG